MGDPAVQVDHARALAAAGEADIGVERLARAVDDATDDRQRHRRGDVGQPLFQHADGADHVEALTGAGRAGDDVHAAVAQAQRLEDVEADLDLLDGIGRKRNPDGVADPRPQQIAYGDGRLDGAGAQRPRLGHADVQRAVDGLGQLVVGGDRQERVGRLHRNLELVEVVVLQDAGVVERALDHRVGTGLAVLLQQVALQGAGVDADAHRAAVVPGGLDHLAHPVGAADVARIDAQAGGAGLGCLDPAAVVEVNVGHQRDLRLAGDGAEGRSGVLVRTGDPDDVGPRLLQPTDLVDRRRGVGRGGVGHRLDRDRRVAADGDVSDHDLAALAALDVAPRTDVGV